MLLLEDSNIKQKEQQEKTHTDNLLRNIKVATMIEKVLLALISFVACFYLFG